MWLSLLIKNIVKFMKNRPTLFLFITVSQVVCVVTVLTVAGMMYAVSPTPQDERGYFEKRFLLNFEKYDDNSLYYYLFDERDKKFVYCGTDTEKIKSIEEKYAKRGQEEMEKYGQIIHSLHTLISPYPSNVDDLPKFGEIKSKCENIIRESSNELLHYYITGYVDGNINYLYTAQNGEQTYMEEYCPDIFGSYNLVSIKRSKYFDTPYQNVKTGDIINLDNKQLVISEIKEWKDSSDDDYGNVETKFHLLFENAGDNFTVCTINFFIKDTTDIQGIEKIQNAIEKEFGSEIKAEVPKPMPLLEKQFNNMIYVVSGIIIFVVLMNVLRLYTFIMSTRKKSFAVFSICGAGKLQIFLIYILEITLVMIFSFIIGIITFQFAIISPISVLYPSFEDIFNTKFYLAIFGVYILSGMIIMTVNMIPLLKNQLSDMRKE